MGSTGEPACVGDSVGQSRRNPAGPRGGREQNGKFGAVAVVRLQGSAGCIVTAKIDGAGHVCLDGFFEQVHLARNALALHANADRV